MLTMLTPGFHIVTSHPIGDTDTLKLHGDDPLGTMNVEMDADVSLSDLLGALVKRGLLKWSLRNCFNLK